jgi:hypothetical protein
MKKGCCERSKERKLSGGVYEGLKIREIKTRFLPSLFVIPNPIQSFPLCRRTVRGRGEEVEPKYRK